MIVTNKYFDTIKLFDQWLDDNVSGIYNVQPLAQDWARVGKVIEELGEAIQALIGYTGQNPRKGISHTKTDMLEELADVAGTAILAIQHFTKDIDYTSIIIMDKMRHNWERVCNTTPN